MTRPMTRPARLLAPLLAVAAALPLAGCFDKEDYTALGETEGIYVTVDQLKYQVQLSRILNPASSEDQGYLRGVAPGEEELDQDEVWFGIFMRVENDSDEPHPASEEFVIHDTQDAEFQPLELDAESNVFAYEAQDVLPGNLLPELGSPASDNTIGGSLVLFKVRTGSLYNRPLELEIASPTGGENGIVELDV